MNVLNDRTPNSWARRGISSICASRVMIAWNTMSTRLPAATAFCISGSTSTYEPRVMTKGRSVVTPPVTAWRLSLAQSPSNDCAAVPRCRCVSRSPGRTYRPPASIVRRASTVSPGASAATITPSRIARPHSTTASGFTTRAPLTNRSAVTVSDRVFQDLAVGVGAPELEEAPEVARVVAHLRVDVGVEDLVLLVARAAHDVALGVDEERGAEVVAVGGAPDVLADLVDAAHVEHVGDRVAAQFDLPHLTDPFAVGRGGHEQQVSALKAEDARRLGKVAVVADEDPDLDAERRVEDREAQVARREEEALVARRLAGLHGAQDLRNGHLAVPADEVAVRAQDRCGVVERAVVVLVERVDDDGARLLRDLGEPIHRGTGDRLGGLEPVLVAGDAEADGGGELGEADDPGAVPPRLPREGLRLLDVDPFGLVTAGLDQRWADHRDTSCAECPDLTPSMGGGQVRPPRVFVSSRQDTPSARARSPRPRPTAPRAPRGPAPSRRRTEIGRA